MGHPKSKPKNLSEAIQRLENASHNHGHMGDDLKTIREAIEELKPHLKQFKTDVGQAAGSMWEDNMSTLRDTYNNGKENVKEFGQNVDQRVHEHPWWAMGLVGLVALLVGYLLGRKD